MNERIAIVTGASSGIGREFAKQLGALPGLDAIWLVARRMDRLEAIAKELPIPAVCIPLDLLDRTSAAVFSERLAKAAPDVRYFVHAAGFGKFGTYQDLTTDEIDGMIDLNARASVHLTYAVLPYMQRGSRVLLLGSASAFQPLPEFNLYASTKAFVVHFSRALNVELRPRGISVTAVCPGFVRTEFFEVAKRTKNPETCQHFSPMYEPADVVQAQATGAPAVPPAEPGPQRPYQYKSLGGTPMKKLLSEFKEFALRGNVIDLAVGVIVGSAFSAIVTSLVNDIISPLLGLLFQQDFAELSVSFGGITLAYGAFITAVINFLIVTLALFAVVKAINTASRLFKRKQEETPAEPAVKVCPFCKSEIAIDATRCPHCTSSLDTAD